MSGAGKASCDISLTKPSPGLMTHHILMAKLAPAKPVTRPAFPG